MNRASIFENVCAFVLGAIGAAAVIYGVVQYVGGPWVAAFGG